MLFFALLFTQVTCFRSFGKSRITATAPAVSKKGGEVKVAINLRRNYIFEMIGDGIAMSDLCYNGCVIGDDIRVFYIMMNIIMNLSLRPRNAKGLFTHTVKPDPHRKWSRCIRSAF